MVFKPAGVDENGLLTPRVEARLNARDLANRQRVNHTGTQTASTIVDFVEAAQDAAAAMLQQGTGVTLTYNDTGNTLTVTSTGGTGGGITDPEIVRDTIGAALLGVGNISVALNDAADTITITTTATQNSTDAFLRARGNHTGTQLASTISDLPAVIDDAIAGISTTVTLETLPPGSAIVIDYFKAVFGAANSWPAARPTTRTNIDVTWRGPTDPGGIMLAGDIYEYTLGQ